MGKLAKAAACAAMAAACGSAGAARPAPAAGCAELFSRMGSLYGTELVLRSSEDRQIAARRFVKYRAWAIAAGLDPMFAGPMEIAAGEAAEERGALEGMPKGEAACEALAHRMQREVWPPKEVAAAWQAAVQELAEIDWPLASAEAKRIAAWGRARQAPSQE